MRNKIKDKIESLKIASGIIKKTPLTGPWTVQIDLTNQCNQNCVGCWCHSHLLEELAMDAETKKKFLPYKLVLRLIDDLCKIGTREIYFTGGGEPFMHQKAIEIIEYVKKKGMKCDMSNNFSLMTKEKARRLIKAKVDNMNCSIWAGSPETYIKTHPNKTEKDFHKIQELFLYFHYLKKKYKTNKPTLNIYNVISSYNYDDFNNMIEFAFKCRIQGIDFTPTDIVPGKTDSLMLNKRQREKLIRDVKNILPKMREFEKKYKHKVIFRNYTNFLRRISSDRTEEGVYDKSIIGKIPCYAGWTFLRILADGNVNSCLKSVRIPIGNIYENSIKEIWYGEKQTVFRKHTINYDVNNPYFQNMGNLHQKGNGCLLCCDNLGLNLIVHNRIKNLKPYQKKILKL